MKQSWALQNDEYRELRNSLIPAAEEHADKVCGPEPKKAGALGKLALYEWGEEWNRVYHKEMQAKARLIGLVR
jgi:hypothetical protein